MSFLSIFTLFDSCSIKQLKISVNLRRIQTVTGSIWKAEIKAAAV